MGMSAPENDKDGNDGEQGHEQTGGQTHHGTGNQRFTHGIISFFHMFILSAEVVREAA